MGDSFTEGFGDAVDGFAKLRVADRSEDEVHLNSRGYFNFAQETLKVLEQQTGLRIGSIEAP
jgi:lysophospholipase L1-like esterase